MAGTARTFRVFVSSTFDDLEDERNWLQAEVFPALSRLCEANGARFQAIDLRWGVRTEASLDQKAMEICHAEIERCQRTGIKPNFIALLGDRYGWRPLPARIELNEFLNIRGQVRHADDCILVDEWYRRDDFADPPEYLLMPRTGRFTADDAWSDVEQRLHAALRQAAHQARLPRAALLRYEASATHQEILQGMGDTEASREHVFAFCRDSRKNDPEDADLRALKDVLEAQLKSNVYHYDEGDLREFGNRVDSSLRAVILREISRFKDRSVDEVERETQANVSIEHTRHFKGREQVMRAALHGAAAGDRRPTVIHGVSGSGKSALVARCAEIAAEQATGDIVVRRFVGVSPVSSSGVELLRHAYKEIARAFDIVTTDPASYDEVITAFTDAMRLATAAKPLSLFFDGVDQFRAGDPASALGWIPSELPPYCRMVVSSVGVPPALRGARLIELGALTRAEANDVLSSLLASARRKLPDELREYVLAAFGRSGLPLYLRVAMQECGRWRSFDPRESCVLGEGIDGIIDGFLDRLAEHRSHGPVLLNRALHYLAVSRYGLSEDELLDVLTNDDRVWDDFLGRAKHEPPARQLPAVIWSRLYFDLEDYLTERTVRDTAVIAINHQRIVERIAARIADESERVDTHARLANLFRKAGDPEREMSWTGPLRGMAELPHHLAQSGQQTELRELVGCIPYLDARCGGADVTDLLDDFGLVVPVDAESAVVREFIVQHAHRLAARENLLFGLIQHEGPSILRARADALVTAGRWRKPWLRTTPIPLPHEAPAADQLGVRVVSQYEFSRSVATCMATGAEFVFYLKALGRVAMVDARSMRELPLSLTVITRRVLGLFASADGRYLAIAFEDGELSLLALEFTADREFIRHGAILTTRYFLPEYERPVMRWDGDRLLFQESNGSIALFDGTGVTTMPILSKCHGELSGIAFASGGTHVTTRQGTDSWIWRVGSADAVRIPGADAQSVEQGEHGRLVVGFSDRTVRLFETEPSLSEASSLRLDHPPFFAAEWSDGVLIADQSGLKVWNPARDVVTRLEDNKTLYPAQVLIRCRTIAISGSSGLLFQADSCVCRITLTNSSPEVTHAIEQALVGSDGARWVVQQRGHELWLVECGEALDVRLPVNEKARRFHALDDRGQMLTFAVFGGGALVELASRKLRRIDGPAAINALVGTTAGFWLADRNGGIFRLADIGSIVRETAVRHQGVEGGRLYSSEPWLVWWGRSTEITDHNPSADPQDCFVFFRIADDGSSLVESGVRTFPKEEGTLTFLLGRAPNQELIAIVRGNSRFALAAKLGTPQAFIEGTERTIPFDFDSDVRDCALCADDRLLYICPGDHDLVVVDLDSMRTSCRLISSRPFTAVAGDGYHNVVAVEGGTHLFQCHLEARDHAAVS